MTTQISKGFMKGRLLAELIMSLTTLGCGLLTSPLSVTAEPADMFKPILREIQNQLPHGWVMRLPSVVNISDNQLYPEVKFMGKELFVRLNSLPNCWFHSCQYGAITVAKGSVYSNNLRSDPIFSQRDLERVREIRQRDYTVWTESDKRELIRADGAILDRQPIRLKHGIQGLFVVTNVAGASTPSSLHVIWVQDGLNFRVSIRVGLDRDGNVIQLQKSELINLATSMASETPIRSTR
jgi:hypothetical protein